MPLRRLLATAAVSLTAVSGLAACGEEHEVTVGHGEGIYVQAGELKYQVQISRILNPADWEDRYYLRGIAPSDGQLGRGEDWFGIFLRAFNRTDGTHEAASEFSIEDTTGKVHEPVRIDPTVNPFAFDATIPVGPKQQLPLFNSPGQANTTQGGLVLFKIPSADFDARPFEFRIVNPEGEGEAIVELDI